MGDLIIHRNQLTFPWRERTRICPECKGKGGAPWLSKRMDANQQPDPRKLIPCVVCRGKGELVVEGGEPT